MPHSQPTAEPNELEARNAYRAQEFVRGLCRLLGDDGFAAPAAPDAPSITDSGQGFAILEAVIRACSPVDFPAEFIVCVVNDHFGTNYRAS